MQAIIKISLCCIVIYIRRRLESMETNNYYYGCSKLSWVDVRVMKLSVNCDRKKKLLLLCIFAIVIGFIYVHFITSYQNFLSVEQVYVTSYSFQNKAKSLSRKSGHKKKLEYASNEDFVQDLQHVFVPINGRGIHTYHHVCLENMAVYSAVSVDINEVAFLKRIVIYDSKWDTETELSVAASMSCDKPRNWPVTFRKGPVPSRFAIMPFPAYFVTASQPGNLYHLIRDTLVGLYGVLRDTNRLNSTVKNQVYTRKFFIPFFDARSKNISNHRDLIKSLGVRSFPVYHAGPPNVCYQYGVFGWKPVPLKELAEYLVNYLNFNDSSCAKDTTVTFIEREYRKVTNMDNLVDVTKAMGMKAKKVRLEYLSFQKQYETIRCTDVLVGVQGAGLHWAMFMRPNRAMIELGYPGWKFLFSEDFNNFNGLITKQVLGATDGAQWTWIEREYNDGKPYSPEQKKNFKNPKFLDSKYNVRYFQQVLKDIVRTLAHQ